MAGSGFASRTGEARVLREFLADLGYFGRSGRKLRVGKGLRCCPGCGRKAAGGRKQYNEKVFMPHHTKCGRKRNFDGRPTKTERPAV